MHDRAELERVLALGLEPDLLGINNRDILVGEVDDGDVSLTESLAALVPDGLARAQRERDRAARRTRGGPASAGADAVLVGTSILQAPDPAAAIDALVAVGWTRRGDAGSRSAGSRPRRTPRSAPRRAPTRSGSSSSTRCRCPGRSTARRAAALMRALPPFVARVAVVGGDAATILAIVEATAPDVVQLHLDESEATVAAVRAGLDGNRYADREGDPHQRRPGRVAAARRRGGRARARRFLAAGADAILLDSKTGGAAGRHGRGRSTGRWRAPSRRRSTRR